MRHFRSVAFTTLLTAAALTAGACGEPFGLPRATIPNVVDTVTLFALSGTPVASPSAYRLEFRQLIRVDQSTENSTFDFAFDIDTAGRPLLLPTGPLKLGRASGQQLRVADFDSVTIAPDRGYSLDSALVLEVGTVAIVHSRPVTCTFGISAFYYAKLLVLAIDTTPSGRSVQFQILVNTNCGYRGLAPGVPTR